MTVFKGYIKIAWQSKWIFILYLTIFFGITIMIQESLKSTSEVIYKPQAISIGIVNEDESPLSDSLVGYLSAYHTLVPLKSDVNDLQESLFYREVEYIIRIPADFTKRLLENGASLQVTKLPGSYTGSYVDETLNSFLNNARTYHAAGFTEAEIAEALITPVEASVNVYSDSSNNLDTPDYMFYFRYLPYTFIAILCYALGLIFASFKKGDLPKRMHASAITPKRQILEGLLATSIIGGTLWFVCILMSFVFYGKELSASSNLIYYLINTLSLLLVSLSLAFLVGTLVKTRDALTGIVNTLSLGMSFLCGVFVSLDVLNKNVKLVSQFLPVYWYELANNTLAEFSSLNAAALTTVWQAIGIQLIFAAAFIVITLTVSKKR